MTTTAYNVHGSHDTKVLQWWYWCFGHSSCSGFTLWTKVLDINIEQRSCHYHEDKNTYTLQRHESPSTHLGSCKPGFLWAEPHSWWAGGCAGTGTPSLGRTTSRTSGATRCRSPGGNAPAGPCSSIRTGSRKLWQTRPKSAPEELHPRERLWPTCKTNNNNGLKRGIKHMWSTW